MAWPANVADGDIIMAAHINSIRDSVMNWQGNVSAGGFSLQSVATVSAQAISLIQSTVDSAIVIGEGTGSTEYASFIWHRDTNALELYFAGIGPVQLIRSDGIFMSTALITTTAGPAGTGKLYRDASGFLKIS